MTETVDQNLISIDGKDYKLDSLSEEAKAQITNIQFVDEQLLQLNNEWAIADTARMGYTQALNNELAKIDNAG